MERANQLLADLSSLSGVPMAFDEHGRCVLEIGGTLFLIAGTDTAMLVYAMLGTFEDVTEPTFWQALLTQNVTLAVQQRATLALDKENDTVMLISVLPVSLDGQAFTAEMTRIITLAHELTRELNHAPAAPEEDSATNSAAPAIYG